MLSRLMQTSVRKTRFRARIKRPRIDTTRNNRRSIASNLQADTLRIKFRANRRICSITHRKVSLM
jgi:hypothetical protein